MKEERLNSLPINLAFKSLLFPQNPDGWRMPIQQWISSEIGMLESYPAETELTREQLANLESVANMKPTLLLYQKLTQEMPETADPDLIYNPEKLKAQAKKVLRAKSPERAAQEGAALLEMLAMNAEQNGRDLEPSLHEADR